MKKLLETDLEQIQDMIEELKNTHNDMMTSIQKYNEVSKKVFSILENTEFEQDIRFEERDIILINKVARELNLRGSLLRNLPDIERKVRDNVREEESQNRRLQKVAKDSQIVKSYLSMLEDQLRVKTGEQE